MTIPGNFLRDNSFMKPTNKLVCGPCSACCQWGVGMSEDLRPEVTNEDNPHLRCDGNKLAAQANGNCFYLFKGRCAIHNEKPMACREFDCRTIAKQARDDGAQTIIRVISAGLNRL